MDVRLDRNIPIIIILNANSFIEHLDGQAKVLSINWALFTELMLKD
jgi:hypothetical protein